MEVRRRYMEQKGSRSKKTKEKGGEEAMRIILALTLVAVMSVFAMSATTDSIILLVTPVYNLSVNIVNGTTNFGTISLGASKTLNCGRIWNDGNVSSKWQKYLEVEAADAWTLDTDGHPGSNEFSLLAIATEAFTTPDTTTGDSNTGVLDLGPTMQYHYCTSGWTNLTDGDKLNGAVPTYASGMTADLWVSIMMPTDVTISSEQTMTLSVKAETP